MDVTRCLDDFDPDFKYTNANVSHSWLINYPDSLKPKPETLKISSKNETFVTPKVVRACNKGKRKKIMEAFFRKVISEELLSKYDEEVPIIEEYVTDYTEHFKNPDDMPLPGEHLSKNEKLKMENKPSECSASKTAKVEEVR